jgi:hypothetical protein
MTSIEWRGLFQSRNVSPFDSVVLVSVVFMILEQFSRLTGIGKRSWRLLCGAPSKNIFQATFDRGGRGDLDTEIYGAYAHSV